jgi:hypothetical protein
MAWRRSRPRPLEVADRQGSSAKLGGRKQRIALAALELRAGETVSTGRAAQELLQSIPVTVLSRTGRVRTRVATRRMDKARRPGPGTPLCCRRRYASEVITSGSSIGSGAGEDEPRIFWLSRQWRRRPALVVVIVLVVGLAICTGGHYLLSSNGSVRVTATSGRYTYTAPAGWDVAPACSWQIVRFDDLSCAAPQGETEHGIAVVSTITATTTVEELAAWATDQARQIPDYNVCGTDSSTSGDLRWATVCLAGEYSDQSKSSLRVKARGRVVVLEYCLEMEFSGIGAGCDVIWNHLEVTYTD